MNDAFAELRAARSAWRHATSAGDGVARLRALYTYINTRYRRSCRGPRGDTPTSEAWQRRLHLVEAKLAAHPTVVRQTVDRLAWNQSPTFSMDGRLPAPPVIEALGVVRHYLVDHPPTEPRGVPLDPYPTPFSPKGFQILQALKKKGTR
jgi:hypothetical protein